MAKTKVVSPGLTPDWLEKRKGVMSAIESQLIHRFTPGAKGLDLEHLQALVEHRNPFEREHPEYVFPLHKVIVNYSLPWPKAVAAAGDGSEPSSWQQKQWLLDYGETNPPLGRTGIYEIHVNVAMYPAKPTFLLSDLRKIGRQANLGPSTNARELFALWPECAEIFKNMGLSDVTLYSLDAKQLGPSVVIPAMHWQEGDHAYPAMEPIEFETLRIGGFDDLLPRYCCVAYTPAE